MDFARCSRISEECPAQWTAGSCLCRFRSFCFLKRLRINPIISTRYFSIAEICALARAAFRAWCRNAPAIPEALRSLLGHRLGNTSGNPGLAPNTTVELVTGTLEILPGLNNDGITDFAISVVSAFDADGNDVTSLFGSSGQSLDLQQAIPEPTSLLSLLGLGCLGLSSLMRKSNK